MKKSLSILLALVFVLSIAGTALAAPANPFVDVPAKHWAYDAVSTLAKAGIVDGYGDGTFRGDRTMTRYEMAQIVAKAMAKSDKADAANKALIDKLAVEFAAELNNLGVRVAKVEAKQNTWIGGDTRLRYISNDPQAKGPALTAPTADTKLHGSYNFQERTRLKVWGTINDDVSFAGRLQANFKFGDYANAGGGFTNGSTDGSNLAWDMAAVTAKHFLGIDSIRVGRWVYGSEFGISGLFGKAVGVDGIRIDNRFGALDFVASMNNIKAGQDSSAFDGTGATANANTLTTAQFTTKLGNDLSWRAGYYWADVPGTSTVTGTGTLATTVAPGVGGLNYLKSKGWLTGFDTNFAGLRVMGDYLSTSLTGATNIPNSPKAYSVQVSNSKLNAIYMPANNLTDLMKPGSDAWLVGYRSMGAGSVPNGIGGYDSTVVSNGGQSLTSTSHASDNVNAWYFVYQNTLAKNVLLTFEYQDIRIKDHSLVSTTVLPGNSLDKTIMVKFEFFY
jgi:hypothetical protein